MKAKIIIALVLFLCFTAFLSTEMAATESGESSSPVKFSLWPGIWGIPAKADIDGINFGFVTFGGKEQEIVGLDAGLFSSQTGHVTGMQTAIFSTYSRRQMEGLQLSVFTNSYEDGNGVQLSLINLADNAETSVQIGLGNDVVKSNSIFQLGFINSAEESYGLQIGLLNRNDKGFIPACFFFNFSSK